MKRCLCFVDGRWDGSMWQYFDYLRGYLVASQCVKWQSGNLDLSCPFLTANRITITMEQRPYCKADSFLTGQ